MPKYKINYVKGDMIMPIFQIVDNVKNVKLFLYFKILILIKMWNNWKKN